MSQLSPTPSMHTNTFPFSSALPENLLPLVCLCVCSCCNRSKLQSDLELAEVRAGAELELKARLLEASQAELARREVGVWACV